MDELNLTPEMLQQLIALGAIPEENATFQAQMAQGQGQMQTPGAEGMRVGGTYVAANPLEHLAVALQRGMGGRAVNQGREGIQANLAKQTAGRGGYADALIKALMGGGAPAPQAAVTEMPTMWIGG